MGLIRILDYVENPADYSDGESIFNLLVSELRSDEQIVLSFEGIESTTSAFINSAIVRLLEFFTYDHIRSNLKIVDSTKFINDMIRDRFAYVRQFGNTLENRPKPDS